LSALHNINYTLGEGARRGEGGGPPPLPLLSWPPLEEHFFTLIEGHLGEKGWKQCKMG